MGNTGSSATKKNTAGSADNDTADSSVPDNVDVNASASAGASTYAFADKPFPNGFAPIKDWNAKKQKAYEKRKAKQARKRAAKEATKKKGDNFKPLEPGEGLYDASVSSARCHNIVGGNV